MLVPNFDEDYFEPLEEDFWSILNNRIKKSSFQKKKLIERRRKWTAHSFYNKHSYY
jgi:hypothetical protein